MLPSGPIRQLTKTGNWPRGKAHFPRSISASGRPSAFHSLTRSASLAMMSGSLPWPSLPALPPRHAQFRSHAGRKRSRVGGSSSLSTVSHSSGGYSSYSDSGSQAS